MKQIIEIVPNYSEGKNEEIMNAIIKPFVDDPNINLVHMEMDPSYNRSVVTVIGEAATVIKQMVESAVIATQLIDLRIHKGEHPRLGAVDVCPIIPIRDITEEECISLSKRLAEEINLKTNVPIYLYSKAATKDHCVNLPDIRDGEFEGLFEKMKNPKWFPDYGKNIPHPSAGAYVVGVRNPLIAFNIDLNSNDRNKALKIARKVRFSGGGYRFLQANPARLMDKKIVQISMNLTDYTQTALYQAIEAVKMEARRFNIVTTTSEIVGLVSKDCLVNSLKYYLGKDESELLDLSLDEVVQLSVKYFNLRDFSVSKIIEYYL